MDIVSVFFASYLDAVSNSVYSSLTDSMGLDVQAKVVQYEGYNVSYSYQMWRIKDESVCHHYSNDMREYSLCTEKAKHMFMDMCIYLQENEQSSVLYQKHQSMYCSVATNYKPTIASISSSSKTPYEKLEENCNVAILNALGSADKELISAREQACEKFKNHAP